MSLHIQLMTMVTMIVGGIYVGFAQETYRKLARLWYNQRFFIYFFEVLFWTIQAIVLFYLLYRVNNGELRLYIILACFLGFSMYVVFLQSAYQALLNWLVIVIRRILFITYRIVSFPIRISYRMIKSIVLGITRICWKVISFFAQLFKKATKKILPEKTLIFISKMTMICSTIIDKLILFLKKLFRLKRG